MKIEGTRIVIPEVVPLDQSTWASMFEGLGEPITMQISGVWADNDEPPPPPSPELEALEEAARTGAAMQFSIRTGKRTTYNGSYTVTKTSPYNFSLKPIAQLVRVRKRGRRKTR